MGAQTSRVPLPRDSINWYRTKLPSETHSVLHRTSDVRGAIQTIGWLGNLLLWFGLALHFHASSRYLLAFVFTTMYGMQANFAINGMHELGHGYVFKTRCLNSFFLRIYSFVGWLHPDMFFSSHLRHHRYTQNYPHDQENPMPVVLSWTDFWTFGFINVQGCYQILTQTVKAACGIYPTCHLGWTPEWEEICYPSGKPLARQTPMYWAQFLLCGHSLIAVWSFRHGLYLVPLLVSLGPFYNGWLFWLCNSTQHVGLHHGNFDQNTVDDFRLTTRTFYLNSPIVEFWYWHMNYHCEHHMYAAVPCYNLAALHTAIKDDLPPTPNGLVEVWHSIMDACRKQGIDPHYMQPITLPKTKQETKSKDK